MDQFPDVIHSCVKQYDRKDVKKLKQGRTASHNDTFRWFQSFPKILAKNYLGKFGSEGLVFLHYYLYKYS